MIIKSIKDGGIVGKTIEGTVMRKIKRNCIQCKHCGDIIASEHRYDYKSCKCGCVAVDGGDEYLRRSARNGLEDFIELSEYED